MKPKITEKKKHMLTEMILKANLIILACALCINKTDNCNKCNIKVSSKRRRIEHTNKLQFLVGTYAKVASPKFYLSNMNEKIKISNGALDAKKRCTHEKGTSSKTLIVYAIESKAKKINSMLSDAMLERHKHASCKNTYSDKRLAARHFREMKNAKTRCEVLFNANLKDKVLN